ncbi:MAG: DrmB family protein, partial [Chloroflexota bacterium]
MKTDSINVGEIRPSQLMFTYGIGAIVDLPRLSVIVTGLEDWPTNPEYARRITEERLLTAVRYKYHDVQELIAPPIVPEAGLTFNPFSKPAQLGAPVAVFPRWLVCPACQILAPIKDGLFKLKPNFYAPDRTAYIHESCNKAKAPEAIPARFLVACEKGHLDDFPWIEFVHVRNGSCLRPQLRLIEYGPSGEARELEVKCDNCGERRRLAEAFGEDNRSTLPRCRGRRPHLRDYERDGCKNQVRTIILGASNTWFPVVLSTIAIPTKSNRLAQLVEDKWATLQNVTSLEVLLAFRNAGLLGIEISQHPDKDIWAEIQAHDKGASSFPETSPDLRAP